MTEWRYSGASIPATIVEPTIVGVPLAPLVIALIEYLKKLYPNAKPRLWLVLSLLLATVGQWIAGVIEHGSPVTFEQWVSLTVTGLVFGLATSKVYDIAVAPRSEADSG